jgi:hypothetical protein
MLALLLRSGRCRAVLLVMMWQDVKGCDTAILNNTLLLPSLLLFVRIEKFSFAPSPALKCQS